MNIETILKEQIAELEKLIQLKDKRIVELENQLNRSTPFVTTITGTTTTEPLRYTPWYSTTSCIHDYQYNQLDNGSRRCIHCGHREGFSETGNLLTDFMTAK
jgi:hypothetical protein